MKINNFILYQFEKLRLRRQFGLLGLVAGVFATSLREPFRSPEVAVYQFPPKPRIPDTVFSDVYQSEIPRDLYDAGIKRLDVETVRAVLSMRGIIGSAQGLRGEGYGCPLDLQDSVMRMYAGLGEHLGKVNQTALVSLFGDENPIVKLVQDAGRKYEATVREKSNLDKLMERFPNDPTAVFNIYHG